jgi:hypothetical protein
MTETDPEKRLIGYACISTYGQMLDTQLSRAHLRRRRRFGIGRLTDPTAAGQLWLRAGSSCPKPDRPQRLVFAIPLVSSGAVTLAEIAVRLRMLGSPALGAGDMIGRASKAD